MFNRTEKEQKYIKKMIEAERIKRKRAGLLRKQQQAARDAKKTCATS